jgi:DNA repair exonuclease SbcCD ATPase subunit
MSNQQTIRQLLTLDNRIKQLESLFQSTNPNVSLASVSSANPNDLKVLKDEIEKLKKAPAPSGVNPNDLKVLKDEIEKLKKAPAPSGVNPNDLKVLKDEIEKLKKAPPSSANPNDLKVLKDEIEKLKKAPASSANPNDLKVLKDEIEKLKKNSKEITDIDKMIKTNFDETNRKFEEVNKGVNSLDANLEKANKIEKDVEELKKRH